MGISKAGIAKLVENAFPKFGDLRTTVTYRQVVPGVYDPVTDTTSDTVTNTTVDNAILASLSKAEYGWFPADRNTQKVLIPYNSLPGVTPGEADKIIINGLTWEIVRIKTPTGAALYIFYVELA